MLAEVDRRPGRTGLDRVVPGSSSARIAVRSWSIRKARPSSSRPSSARLPRVVFFFSSLEVGRAAPRGPRRPGCSSASVLLGASRSRGASSRTTASSRSFDAPSSRSWSTSVRLLDVERVQAEDRAAHQGEHHPDDQAQSDDQLDADGPLGHGTTSLSSGGLDSTSRESGSASMTRPDLYHNSARALKRDSARVFLKSRTLVAAARPTVSAQLERQCRSSRSSRVSDRQDQRRSTRNAEQAEAEPARRRAGTRRSAVGVALEALEERDPAGDAAVPPRPGAGLDAVERGHVRQGVGEDPDADRAERRPSAGLGRRAAVRGRRGAGNRRRPHETARQPKTSAWRSNRRETMAEDQRGSKTARQPGPAAASTIVGPAIGSPGSQARPRDPAGEHRAEPGRPAPSPPGSPGRRTRR